jgi:hypothetical protein
MMSSSEQAFLKLDEWRRSNTVLKLTMLVDGEKPGVKFIQIVAVDQITSRRFPGTCKACIAAQARPKQSGV